MNKFINRKNELKYLDGLYTEQGGKLAIVYGRRRLGKTSLLKQFSIGKEHCYFMANRAGEILQINAMGKTLAASLNEPMLDNINFTTWDELFIILTRILSDKNKFVFIIDEYQYLSQVQPAFSSIIQKWWDEHWKNKNIFLILCGSITSMMYKETLAQSAPLYGRSDLQLLLKPINYKHLNKFLPNINKETELVKFYALCGGVPRYLELAQNYKTYNQAINHLLLDKNSLLFNEGKYLLHEEISSPNTCWSILHALGTGSSKISELGNKLSLPANQLTRYIDLLKDLFLIYREVPILEKNPSKSKKGIYRISDPFIKLWFACIYPYESFLEFDEKEKITEKLKPLLDSHIEYCYEELCRQYIKNHIFDFDCIKVGRQWSGKYEIDIAGVNNNNELSLIGECKWSNKHIGLSIYHNLQKVINDNNLPISKNVKYILFSKSGFSKDLTKLSKENKSIILINSIF